MSDNNTNEPQSPDETPPLQPENSDATPTQPGEPLSGEAETAPTHQPAPPAPPVPPYVAPEQTDAAPPSYATPEQAASSYAAPDQSYPQQPGGYAAPPAPGYPVPPAPGYPAATPDTPRGKGLALTALLLAIAAMIFGILSFWWPAIFLGTVVGISAIVFAIIALVKKQSKGMSITALILAPIAAIVSGIVLLISGFLLIGQLVDESPGFVEDILCAELTEEECEEMQRGLDDLGVGGSSEPQEPVEQPEETSAFEAEPLIITSTSISEAWEIEDGSMVYDYAVWITNPNTDVFWNSASIDIEGYDADGNYVDYDWSYQALFPGENLVSGTFTLIPDGIEVNEIEVTLPDTSSASALPDGVTGIDDLIVIDEATIGESDGVAVANVSVSRVGDAYVDDVLLIVNLWDGDDLVLTAGDYASDVLTEGTLDLEIGLLSSDVDISGLDATYNVIVGFVG
ncbi:DUF308 domain-containing protein [Microbacterium amylolyticum]|uniref:DUF4352 domain-containing protein n=1 Tax=Microbacterium amylolyticum TaxID=936337 RepID=A0ABS4ZFU2_9MICO|nr:DUF308 domain-containing protein [Microbacterium amylolyticum]MBP2435878.1 hypothetical protein [Microbacterium amylolyticum]